MSSESNKGSVGGRKLVRQTTAFWAVVFLLTVAFSAPAVTKADTEIPFDYTISGEETWTAENSPYILMIHPFAGGVVTILDTGTLNIEPGVEVKVQGNNYGWSKFYVYGRLNVLGDETNHVLITSFADDGSENPPVGQNDKWGGITFYPGSVGSINYLDEKFAGRVGGPYVGGQGILNMGGEVEVGHSTFEQNDFGIENKSGTTTLNAVLVAGGSSGVSLNGGYLSLTNSTVSNVGLGLYLNIGRFYGRDNNLINNVHQAGIGIGVDFDVAGTNFSGGDYAGWFLGAFVSDTKTLHAADAPFVADVLNIDQGAELTIAEGVVIKFRDGGSFYNHGILNIQGTKDRPVYIVSVKDDSVGGDTNNDGGATVSGALHYEGLINFADGRADLKNVVVKHGGSFNWAPDSRADVQNLGGVLTVEDSAFAESLAGIYTNGGAVNILRTDFNSGLKSYGGVVSVSQSRFMSPVGVANYGTETVLAENNWWGDLSGPYHADLNPSGLGSDAVGDVDFDPWLSYDPDNPPVPECCSSVAFIPGLEASRLYKQGSLFEDQLWEPNNNNDVRQLFLSSETGESLDSGIYTREAVDEAGPAILGGNIYKGFLEFMNNLVAEGDIPAFEVLPYDWRFDVKNVATNPIKLEFGSYSMVTEIEGLASISPTGKVSVITHSNGGLVVKELVEELKRQDKENLIDLIIMVAAPELGTPDAVLQLLHGSKFFLGFPSKEVTRELGENMKSAYALLPSREYFDKLPEFLEHPIIEFSTTTSVTKELRDIYGDSISDYDTLRRFLRGENGARTEPAPKDVFLPNVLKEVFLSGAEESHARLDSWLPPDGMRVVEIVGWGLDTPYGIFYDKAKKKVCNDDLSVCQYMDVLDPRPVINSGGDKTVAYFSAEALGEERYYVNLNEYNENRLFNLEHKNILEVDMLQVLLSMLIKKEDTATLPEFVSLTKPTGESGQSFRLGVHSPVELHLYDSFGRHTGPVPKPSPDSDLELYEEQIPNSYYFTIGEGQYAGAVGETTAVLQGSSLGTFSVDVDRVVGGNVTNTTVYKDIPVATTTTATLELNGTTEPILSIDVDGDGNEDVSITPGGLTAEELVGLVKGLVKTLGLSKVREKLLLKRLDKLAKELAIERRNERLEKLTTRLAFARLLNTISRYEKRKLLTKDESAELITMIENIRNMVVE